MNAPATKVAAKVVSVKPTAQTSSAPVEKKARKPKAPGMTMAQKFDLQAFVKDANPATPDGIVAKEASAKFGREVSQQTVAGYRKEFGLASVRMPTVAELMARVAELEQALSYRGAQPE